MGSSTVGSHVEETLRKDGEGTSPSPEECIAQIDRLVGSPRLLGSKALCKLLKYLAHHTIHTPTDHLKEYEIATEAFGRPPGFDPQTDSYVRVQMGRLRAKLANYYETEGAADSVLIDVPKGRYVLLFERRGAPAEPALSGKADTVQQDGAEAGIWPAPWRGRRLALGVLAAAGMVAIASAGLGVVRAMHASASVPAPRLAANRQADMLAAFWTPFIQGPDEPIVVFSNATFVGDAETGMRYYEPPLDQHSGVTEHYTGVGEVMGVLELDRLLEGYGRQFRLKRGSFFTLDDARTNNLIFVGSPTENLTLGQIPGTQEFVFRHVATGPDHWKQAIINTHPLAGESPLFAPSGQRGHEGDEYAVVALRRGLGPARWTLILAGTSTIGTQAAVDYVCDAGSVESLMKRLHVSKAAELRPFEALLRVKVANDVPLAVQLIALRQTER